MKLELKTIFVSDEAERPRNTFQAIYFFFASTVFFLIW